MKKTSLLYGTSPSVTSASIRCLLSLLGLKGTINIEPERERRRCRDHTRGPYLRTDRD
jgi:hypothetical protein